MARSEPARIERVRGTGDPNHRVVDTEGGGCGYRREPCPGCPWRVDQTGGFPPGAFAQSAETSYDQAVRMFGCHTSGTTRPQTCAGFLLRGAAHNIAARMAFAGEQFDLDQLSDGGHELHPSYRAMAEANGVPADHPALRRCRGNDE